MKEVFDSVGRILLILAGFSTLHLLKASPTTSYFTGLLIGVINVWRIEQSQRRTGARK